VFVVSKYNFNNEEYSNLNDLALAFIENFDIAIDSVKTNYKKLLGFIKYCNRKIYKQALDVFYTSKYVSNVTTFFIYMFLDEKAVYINGKLHTIEDFVEGFRTNPELYKAFIKDYGLERTYCRMYKDSNLALNAKDIRLNIDDEFVSLYISEYFKFDGLEAIKQYIALDDSNELFNNVNDSFKSNDFQLILAQKYGLKAVLTMREEHYPIFKGLKLVKEFFTLDEIANILSNNHLTWLLANFDKYSYKGKAKELNKKLKASKKLFNKNIKSKNIDSMIDQAYEVSLNYLSFIEFYGKKLIMPKKKVSKDQYDICINYCDGLISKACAEELSIKVFNEDLVSEIKIKNKKEIVEINSKKERKRINKLARYNRGLIFFDFIAIIYLAVAFGLSITENPIIKLPLADHTLDIVCIALAVLILFFAYSISRKIESSRNAYNKVVRLRNLYNKELEIPNKEQEIKKLEAKDKKNLKRTLSSRRIRTALTCTMLSFVYSVLLVSVFNNFLASTLDQYVEWSNTYNVNSSAMMYVIIGPVLAFIYGLVRRRKGFFTNVLIILLSIVGVLVPVLL
jgi:hypothetical protein